MGVLAHLNSGCDLWIVPIFLDLSLEAAIRNPAQTYNYPKFPEPRLLGILVAKLVVAMIRFSPELAHFPCRLALSGGLNPGKAFGFGTGLISGFTQKKG